MRLQGTFISNDRAARLAGITPSSLRVRRMREGDEHPEHYVIGGRACLYREEPFLRYVATWRDSRYDG